MERKMSQSSPNIQFRRNVRDCPSNSREREKAVEQKRKPRLIIDWIVLIDGEHRATFMSNVSRRGYVLRDLLYNEVRASDRKKWRVGSDITKDDFRQIVTDHLPVIPTVAAVEAEKARIAAEKAASDKAARQEEIARARRLRLNGAAESLLDATRDAILYFDAPSGSPRLWPVARANLRAKLVEAYVQATGASLDASSDDDAYEEHERLGDDETSP